jgi:hypothetical protein
VPNWSISRNYNNIWNSIKDSVTTGMFETRRPMGSNHKSTGHKARPAGPTPWLASHTLSRFRSRLDCYGPQLVYKSIPCLRARPSITSKPTQLSQWKLPSTSIEGSSWYNSHTPHSSCSSPLVNSSPEVQK